MEKELNCFVVSALFSAHTSQGRFLCQQYFKKCIEAQGVRDAKEIFERLFTSHMAKRYHLAVEDIQLLQHGSMTVKKVPFESCIKSKKRAEKKLAKKN